MNTDEHESGKNVPIQSEFLMYTTEDGKQRIKVRLEGEKVLVGVP